MRGCMHGSLKADGSNLHIRSQPRRTQELETPLKTMSTRRCEKCQAIKSEHVLSRFGSAGSNDKLQVVYDSLEYLDESADRGCDMCALLYRHVVLSEGLHCSGPIKFDFGNIIGIEMEGMSSLMSCWTPGGDMREPAQAVGSIKRMSRRPTYLFTFE